MRQKDLIVFHEIELEIVLFIREISRAEVRSLDNDEELELWIKNRRMI